MRDSCRVGEMPRGGGDDEEGGFASASCFVEIWRSRVVTACSTPRRRRSSRVSARVLSDETPGVSRPLRSPRWGEAAAARPPSSRAPHGRHGGVSAEASSTSGVRVFKKRRRDAGARESGLPVCNLLYVC